MSYSFNMFFTECHPEDVLDTCLATVDSIMSIADKYMKDNALFLPNNKFDLEGKRYKYAFIDAYLYRLFNFRFVYWKEHQILGLSHFGNSIEDVIEPYFSMSVHFQNSCDQDYAYDTWNGIKMFEDIADRAKTYTVDEIINSSDGYYIDRDREDIESNVEYYRRASAYRTIFNDLDLNDWLYGRHNDSFRRLAINGIDSMEKLLDLNKMLPPKDEF